MTGSDHRTSADAFVYGLRFTGLAGTPGLPTATDDDPTAPAVEVRQSDDEPPTATDAAPATGWPVVPTRTVRVLTDSRTLALDPVAGPGEVSGRAVLYGPPLDAADLAHPYLTPIAVPFTRWNGRETFHGGVFATRGHAWVVPGARTAGKSSLMAALAGRGIPVLADDMAMTDGEVVHTGPRSIDLREPVPGVNLPHRTARGGTRRRLLLPPAPRSLPLGGWVFLHWSDDPSDDVQLRPVPPTTLLARLARNRARTGRASDPAMLLALALRPAFDLVRPRRWDAVPEVLAALDDELRPEAARAPAGGARP